MKFLTSDFDFDLPESLIAQHPITPKDNARLLVINQRRCLQNKLIKDLPSLFHEGDVLVVNNTKVIPARLSAKKNNATIGITLDQPLPSGQWHVLFKNSKRLKVGDRLDFKYEGTFAKVITLDQGGSGSIQFNIEGDDFDQWLYKEAQLALPPYIHRPNGLSKEDLTDYQPIFSRYPGAVAAPTASLHFTQELLSQLAVKGIEKLEITLHVGAGTFLPIKTSDPSQHHMHSEFGQITAEVANKINQAKQEKRRIISVGTTTLRLLESAVNNHGILCPYDQPTSIFIQPGFQFKVVDCLLTNFHLPRSTLFMLVCAFAGIETMQNAYEYAIQNKYRFYSYGDACLLEQVK